LLRRDGKGQREHCTLKALVQQHIQDRLSEWESGLYENGAAEKLSQDNSEWPDALSAFGDSAVDDLSNALRRNDLSVIETDADALIARHQIDVVKGGLLPISLTPS